MARTYNISGEWYDSLVTVNKQGFVTGATQPLQSAQGKYWNNIKKRAEESGASIYNEVDTLEVLKTKNKNLQKLIDKFDLEEY